MPAQSKAVLEKENETLKRRVADLEEQLAACKAAGETFEPGRAGQAPAEANAKLEKLFEVLPVGISVLDHQGRVVNQNPMLEGILGFSAEELARGEYRRRQYIHPDGTPFSAEEFPSARVLQGEEAVRDVEIGIIKEDGQRIWTSVSAAAVPFEEWKVVIATRDITAQMLAEQALRESEGRFSFVFHGNPAVQLISRVDNGRILDVNEACCRLLGLSREELIGRNAAGLDFWADSVEKQQKIQSTRRAGGMGPFEVNVRQRSGEIRTVVVSSLPIVFGEVKAVITTAIDVTEHKRSEQALRESEQRFSSIFNQGPIAMALSRLSDGQLVDVNPAITKLLGFSRAEMLGHTAVELGIWGRIEDRPGLMKQMLAHKQVINFETISRTKSGAELFVLLSAQTVEINQEEFLLGEIVDITERKRAEQLAQEREHFISSILNLTPANIYVYDMETQSNVFSMDGITRLLGYSVEDIRVMGTELFSTLVHPDDLAGLNAFQTRIMALADGEIIENESRAKHRNGSWHVLHTYESPFLRNADGTIKQKIGVAIDVTEQRQAQKDLENSHTQLQTLSRKLIETQEKERRAIGRELHDEIGQSLTGLRILLQMAQRLPQQERENKMRQAQEVAGELIDRISAISLDLRPPMLDDLGLLPTLLWFMGRYTSQTNVRVDFLHTGLQNKRFASVIETAVFRLVQEALTNVARHAGVASVSVRVDAGDTFIAISVEDEGRGFDIQSAFGQNDTGGLNGMRERVHLLRGDLDIDSAPGEGAYISISLPLDRKDKP